MTFVPANARTLTTSATRLDSETETFVASSFDPTQVTSATNRSSGDPRTAALQKTARPPHIALSVALRGRDGGATAELGGTSANALRSARGGGSSPCICINARQDPLTYGNHSGPLDTNGSTYAVKQSWRVRRLTPVECERLQGFPDGYTEVPGASDSARYAALGNSMAVPVLKWIGQRIEMVTRILEAA